MALTWNEATFDSMYSIRIRDPEHPKFGQREGYTRLGMARCADPYSDDLTLYEQRRDVLLGLGIEVNDRILFVGSGFGFLAETFDDLGYRNVTCLDSSDYIEREWSAHAAARLEVIFEDARNVPAVLGQVTGKFHWVVTESVVESYRNEELDEFLDSCEGYLVPAKPTSNVVHIYQPAPVHPSFNSKTREQWVATRPEHTWMTIHGEVG